MELIDIIRRKSIPLPWEEGEKIPWNDPEFSQRMLQVHLSQEHDAASRRYEIIDRHIKWIHNEVLQEKSSRILDLCCGPGLYINRLAGLGHDCKGIDFSPASIAYAKEQAEAAGLECTYFRQDIRTADYGEGYDLIMLIFGEFNVFRRKEAKVILEKVCRALVPEGYLLLEPHTFAAVEGLGKQPASWYTTETGLFLDRPHMHLQENFWNAEDRVSIHRYYIIEAATGRVTCHAASMQAYTNEEYRSLLDECGFGEVEIYPALGGNMGSHPGELMSILSRKRPIS